MRVVRSILEINCGVSDGQSPDNRNQEAGLSATPVVSYGGVPTNRCGAGLDIDDDASATGYQNDFQESAETDRLAACRMTLLEDVMVPSNDNSTICPSLSVERPSTASISPLVVEVEDSTSTNYPDTTPPGLTTVKADKISSNDDGFSVAIGSSPSDTFLRSNCRSGFRSFGTEHRDCGSGTLTRFEPKSSYTSRIFPAASNCGSEAGTTVPIVVSSVLNSDRRRIGTGDKYDDFGAETSTSLESECPARSSVFSNAFGRDIKEHSLNVVNSVCNGRPTQHSVGTADKVYCFKEEVPIYSEANDSSVASLILSPVPSCGSDSVQKQSATTKYSDYDCDRHPYRTVGKANDGSWRQNVRWSTDGSPEREIKSPSAWTGVGCPRGPTPWSLGSYGSRMRGLRIPSTTASSTKETTTTSHDGGRRCLDLPLIVGTTARRIDDSSRSGVLPATLLPRPFMPPSCYRSVRPSFSTTSASRGTDNSVDNGDFITRTTSTNLPPPISTITDSTTASDAKKAPTASCPTSSSGELPNKSEIRPFYTAASTVNDPAHQTDNWCSTLRGGKTLMPPINAESIAVNGAKNDKPICPETTHFQRGLNNEVADSKGVQTTRVLCDSSASYKSRFTTEGRQSVLASCSMSYSCQKPSNGEIGEITDSRSSDDVYVVSPSLVTSAGQSLSTNDRQPPTCKPQRPPTMPKPTRSCPAPSAARVTAPPSRGPHRSVTEDNAVVTSSAASAGGDRTGHDGGSDADIDELKSCTSLICQTNSTYSAATEAVFSVDSYPPSGNQFTLRHNDEISKVFSKVGYWQPLLNQLLRIASLQLALPFTHTFPSLS